MTVVRCGQGAVVGAGQGAVWGAQGHHCRLQVPFGVLNVLWWVLAALVRGRQWLKVLWECPVVFVLRRSLGAFAPGSKIVLGCSGRVFSVAGEVLFRAGGAWWPVVVELIFWRCWSLWRMVLAGISVLSELAWGGGSQCDVAYTYVVFGDLWPCCRHNATSI